MGFEAFVLWRYLWEALRMHIFKLKANDIFEYYV